MSAEYKFKLPFRAVGVNQAYRHARGMTYKTKVAREFQNNSIIELEKQYPEYEPIKENVKVYIDFLYTTKRNVDVDAGVKLVLDTLNGLIIEDDAQIQSLVANKYMDSDVDAVFVEIRIMN